MGFKKKKNVMLLTLCMVTCFILYQIYFFFTISSETANKISVVPVLDHDSVNEVVHVRSEADKFINELGALKGVLRKDMLKFRPSSDNKFKCLKSEQRIPFKDVNDDFCDCEDGTDEPSTSACSSGVFHCDSNVQYQKKPGVLLSVPSSRVNDGICDCCDGSDEWILQPNKKLLSQKFENHFRYLVALCPNVC